MERDIERIRETERDRDRQRQTDSQSDRDREKQRDIHQGHRLFSCWFNSFIHSFGHFYSAPSSPLLLKGAPDYSTDTVSEFHAEAHRQLQVKDLLKVLMWRLERESNPRPSCWKSSPQPRRRHVPPWWPYLINFRTSLYLITNRLINRWM